MRIKGISTVIALLSFLALIPYARIACANTVSDLRAAIVKYPYTWHHGKTHYEIVFKADGTGHGKDWSFTWTAVNPQEIEFVKTNDTTHARLKFSLDYTSYEGMNDSKKVHGEQKGPKSINKNSRQSDVEEEQTQSPQPPISPEMQQKAADLLKTCHDGFVFVNGKDGAGSGFIAAMGGANFLFTNVHVTVDLPDAVFKTLDDAVVQTGTASVAIGRDICRLQLSGRGSPLEMMDNVDANVAVGDDVVVLGNAEGQGVINTITGKIVGIGPDRVEVNAPFAPGSSGSPIIHLKSGKVIGVATYYTIANYDPMTNRKITKPVIRRFGYRLDNTKEWQTVDRRVFYAQATEMKDIETLTGDLYEFLEDLQKNHGVIVTDQYASPLIKNRIDRWVADRSMGYLSDAGRKAADQNLLADLKAVCQSDVIAAKRRITYDYFQRKLAGQQQARDEMSKAFSEIIKSVGGG